MLNIGISRKLLISRVFDIYWKRGKKNSEQGQKFRKPEKLKKNKGKNPVNKESIKAEETEKVKKEI